VLLVLSSLDVYLGISDEHQAHLNLITALLFVVMRKCQFVCFAVYVIIRVH